MQQNYAYENFNNKNEIISAPNTQDNTYETNRQAPTGAMDKTENHFVSFVIKTIKLKQNAWHVCYDISHYLHILYLEKFASCITLVESVACITFRATKELQSGVHARSTNHFLTPFINLVEWKTILSPEIRENLIRMIIVIKCETDNYIFLNEKKTHT